LQVLTSSADNIYPVEMSAMHVSAGQMGNTGFQGINGVQGFSGIPGSTGSTGPTGPQGVAGPTVVVGGYKTASQSILNSAVQIADSQLFCDLQSGHTYAIDGVIFGAVPASGGGISYTLNTPNGLSFNSYFCLAEAYNSVDTAPNLALYVLGENNFGTNGGGYGANNSPALLKIHIQGAISVATGGRLNFYWAQAGANASFGTTVLYGSHIVCTQIS
jgi:hypothetical protein